MEEKIKELINELVESQYLGERAGDLLALVNKKPSDDLTLADAGIIGKKVASMSGKKLQSYLGMIKALGGYYKGRGAGEKRLDDLRKKALQSYSKAKGE